MRTRCPACLTVFRVTTEQLRLKSGKVRCGYCHAVFNALDELIDDSAAAGGASPAVEPSLLPEQGRAAVDAAERVETLPPGATEAAAPDMATHGESPGTADDELRASDDAQPREPAPPDDSGHVGEALDAVSGEAEPELVPEARPQAAQDSGPEAAGSAALSVAEDIPAVARQAAVGESGAAQRPEALDATGVDEALPDAVERVPADDEAERARAAGLVAARELSEAPGYNRWADGVLSGGPGGFAGSERRSRWPYLLAVVVLLVVLAAQAAFAWRVDVVRRIPDAVAVYELFGIAVPLPRDAELISIESSDLQSEPGRGLLVLNAQLRNRASFAQEWPLLELTLTDAGDAVVARRVLAAPDYLPPGADRTAFPPGSEAPVRIWIDARDLGAGGYRLFVFYP
jgi:predicted Zn finger-like uncharacterized protein